MATNALAGKEKKVSQSQSSIDAQKENSFLSDGRFSVALISRMDRIVP